MKQIVVTVKEVTYQTSHPLGQEYIKEHPRETGRWYDKYAVYSGQDFINRRREVVVEAANTVTRRNMQAEIRCRENKSKTLKQLIITDVK